MATTGTDLPTRFASPGRDSMDAVLELALELRDEPLARWFDSMPMPMAVINRHRQILFSNDAFCAICLRADCNDVLGLRPGEALDCIHSHAMKAGCGCSDYCSACGAAIAIIKSLEGEPDCRECRMIRLDHGTAVPLDLQIFTRPVEHRGISLSALYALDVSHEKRLAYLNRTFHHGLINGVGGINAMTDILEVEQDNQPVLQLLSDAAKRVFRDILYHRDLEAAEKGRLAVNMRTVDTADFLGSLVVEECRLRNTQPSCVEVESSCGELWSDPRILRHVLGNMIQNALEAREETNGQITFSCAHLDDGRTAVSLRNPGVMPPDIQKQMFKRYVSTKSRDRGLGAYAMKLFTERSLGGEVNFTSKDGETVFVITLPAPPQRGPDDRQDQ
ncbi:MAG: GHKL domain-containing protein [Desulfovibrionaceae bacterium]|nr:GHKL domain-containing protein [Desulfovibrionaceae bacterium]